MNIVIANSIGKDKNGRHIIHSPSRWSESVDSIYSWFAYYPWELAYLSGLLKRDTGHNVRFIDGCLLRADRKTYARMIAQEHPDMLVMESATRMIDENVAMALEIKRLCGTRLVFVGQHASAFPEQLLREGVDFVCEGEYEFTVLELLQGRPPESIAGLFPNARRPLIDVNRLPWPEDADVSRMAYGIPGEPSSEYREIPMYASRGCPGSCNFCVARHLYYNQPNWRPRDVRDVVAEIKYLREKYPRLEGVFFDEEVHNGSKEFILELSRAIIASGLDTLHYEAMCDIRFIDKDVVAAMKAAGYYKIRVGIETASERVMQSINKNIDLSLVRRNLGMIKNSGLRTYGTFTFGALGADKYEDEKTITYMQRLVNEGLLDNLQFSICTPQPGTPFYNKVCEAGFLKTGIAFDKYDGGSFALVQYPGYNAAEIEALKQRALVIRDHFLLKAKLRNKNFLPWIISILVRHGMRGMWKKALRRIKLEIEFIKIRRGKNMAGKNGTTDYE